MKDAFFQNLEQHVAGAFEAVRVRAEAAGEKFVRTPYTDELVLTSQCEILLPYFEQTVCRALAARQLFCETAPHGVPELPLSSADIEKAIRSKDNLIAVVGYFGRSWACANWGPHPTFRDYGGGLLVCEYTPQHIRTDPELQCEFSPRELKGLDRSLCWGILDRITEFMLQLMKNEEVWRGCGMAADAKRLRGAIEELGGMKLDQKLRDFLDSQ